jgi:hypothetical protein
MRGTYALSPHHVPSLGSTAFCRLKRVTTPELQRLFWSFETGQTPDDQPHLNVLSLVSPHSDYYSCRFIFWWHIVILQGSTRGSDMRKCY